MLSLRLGLGLVDQPTVFIEPVPSPGMIFLIDGDGNYILDGNNHRIEITED